MAQREGWDYADDQQLILELTDLQHVGMRTAHRVVTALKDSDWLRANNARVWGAALAAKAAWEQNQRYYIEDEVANPYEDKS